MLQHRDSFSHSTNEITANPAILYDHSIPIDQMKLKGVGFGDGEAAISDRRVMDRGMNGWIMCRDGCRYRVDGGAVVVLGVWDASIIEKLRIESPADIEARFGKAEKVEDADPVQIYRYNGGKVSVLWNKQEKQVNAVNLTR
ncbi:MAG TPA: hypothetical protein VHD56_10225 [Tepidisphaeraceae bacterium]|nr:hypothetical protein [Tepidisphaeraceae bacterium]